MNQEIIVDRLFNLLVCGDRAATRDLIQELEAEGVAAETLAHEIYWPVLEAVNSMYRSDQLTTLAHHYATRLLRSLINAAQLGYQQAERRNRKIVMFSGPGEADELAGQLVADLAEASGYSVFFGGGGIANDEILEEVGGHRPDILLMFASAPSDAPNIRQLIDSIRGIGACPEMQIVVGGGIFNRAEGLAEEIGADLWAKTPGDLLDRLASMQNRRASADQRTVGRHRKSGTMAA